MDKLAAAIGVFDGVHRGHTHLIDQLKAEAAKRGLRPAVITFSNHPLRLVNPEATPRQICPLPERISRLQTLGVEPIVLDFTEELRSMTAARFLEFIRSRGVEMLMMGFNNRIGSDRKRGSELVGAPVEVIVGTELPDDSASSSLIRSAVNAGDTEGATRLLGRPFSIEGEVVKGRQIGRTIGFPTANISVGPDQLLPPNGVYEAQAFGQEIGTHKAVVNIGRRPTLNNGEDITVEAHLLGFSGDLYGQGLRVDFLRRIRPEMKFNSLDELKAQIQRDIKSL